MWKQNIEMTFHLNEPVLDYINPFSLAEIWARIEGRFSCWCPARQKTWIQMIGTSSHCDVDLAQPLVINLKWSYCQRAFRAHWINPLPWPDNTHTHLVSVSAKGPIWLGYFCFFLVCCSVTNYFANLHYSKHANNLVWWFSCHQLTKSSDNIIAWINVHNQSMK